MSVFLQSIFKPCFLFFQHISLNTMDGKKVFIFVGVLLFSMISAVLGMPMFGGSRVKRSPQTPVSPWCKTAFLNFPRFTPRFCPPNPRCKLTISRFLRDCS